MVGCVAQERGVCASTHQTTSHTIWEGRGAAAGQEASGAAPPMKVAQFAADCSDPRCCTPAAGGPAKAGSVLGNGSCLPAGATAFGFPSHPAHHSLPARWPVQYRRPALLPWGSPAVRRPGGWWVAPLPLPPAAPHCSLLLLSPALLPAAPLSWARWPGCPLLHVARGACWWAT